MANNTSISYVSGTLRKIKVVVLKGPGKSGKTSTLKKLINLISPNFNQASEDWEFSEKYKGFRVIITTRSGCYDDTGSVDLNINFFMQELRNDSLDCIFITALDFHQNIIDYFKQHLQSLHLSIFWKRKCERFPVIDYNESEVDKRNRENQLDAEWIKKEIDNRRYWQF